MITPVPHEFFSSHTALILIGQMRPKSYSPPLLYSATGENMGVFSISLNYSPLGPRSPSPAKMKFVDM